jgi:glycerophosphoryl diester phosphodiesterase
MYLSRFVRWYSAIPVLLALAAATRAQDRCATRPTGAEQLVFADQVQVIAHRGNSGAAPENTLPAFRQAAQAGADMVELDYYHSADGIPVVFHDKDLDRTTNAVGWFGKSKLRVEQLSYCQLRCLDAGSWFDHRYRGVRIPTLNEALSTIQSGSTTLIERKAGDAGTCVNLLRCRGLLDRVVVQAFDWEYLAQCHQLAPQLVLGALGDDELTPDKLDQIALTGARIVGWNHKYIGPDQVAMVHDRDWRMWVYTVNDVPRADELVAAGIDGLITNYPAMMLARLQATGHHR